MVDDGPILVTGAAGQVGSVGRTVVGLLLDRGFPVRAMVRREDERAASLAAGKPHSLKARSNTVKAYIALVLVRASQLIR